MRPVVNGLQTTYGTQVNFIEKDFDDPANAAIVQRYGVKGHPTIVLTDAHGALVERLTGVMPVAQVEDAIHRVISPR